MLSLFQFLLWGLVAIPFVLLLVVVAAAAFGQYGLRKAIKTASTSPCPKCGSIVGRDAILAAKAAYGQKLREMIRHHPGLKFRKVAEWQIQCPKCGFQFYFYPSSNRLETVSIFAGRDRYA